MNFQEAMQRSITKYVKYRYLMPHDYSGAVLAQQEIDLHILPDELCNVRFALQEQYANWSDMERVARALEVPVEEMSVKQQGYSGNEPVCAFQVEKTFHGISARATADMAATCHISIDQHWFPASAEEVQI
jgi:hypothetical protein